MKCANCGEPIEHYEPGLPWYRGGFWIHPDLVDYDCHGTFCADDSGEQAEPPPTTPQPRESL